MFQILYYESYQTGRRRGKFTCPCVCTFDNPKVWGRLLRAGVAKRQRRLLSTDRSGSVDCSRHGAILAFMRGGAAPSAAWKFRERFPSFESYLTCLYSAVYLWY